MKIQRPLSSNDPSLPWLIYSKDRKRQFTMADKLIPSNVRKHIEANDNKAYWFCDIVLNTIRFHHAAPPQDW